MLCFDLHCTSLHGSVVTGEFCSTARIIPDHLWPLEVSTACIAVRWSIDYLTVVLLMSLDITRARAHRQCQECKTTRSNDSVTKIQVFWDGTPRHCASGFRNFSGILCVRLQRLGKHSCWTAWPLTIKVLQSFRTTGTTDLQCHIPHNLTASVMSVWVLIKWQTEKYLLGHNGNEIMKKLISPSPNHEGNKLQRPNSNLCKSLKKNSEGCPSNQVSASDKNWQPSSFFNRVGLRTYQHPCMSYIHGG